MIKCTTFHNGSFVHRASFTVPDRGPRHSVNKGLTPALSSEETTALPGGLDPSTLAGLRDRALIVVMTYTFGRFGAVVALVGGDYFLVRSIAESKFRPSRGRTIPEIALAPPVTAAASEKCCAS